MTPDDSRPSESPTEADSTGSHSSTHQPPDGLSGGRRTSTTTGPGPRVPLSQLTIGFILSGLALVAVGSGHRLLGATEPLVLGWQPAPIKWLFLLSLLACLWYLAIPLSLKRERTKRHVSELVADPPVAVATAYLGAFVAVGILGVVFLNPARGELIHANQPPVLFSASDHVVAECVGSSARDRCYGSIQYLLGTDAHGRSIAVRLLEGTVVSVQVVVIVAALVVPIATLVGTVAGYLGGWTDTILMTYVDVQGTVPAFVVYIVLTYVFGRSLFLLVLVFGLLSWGGIARTVRNETRQITTRGYVAAAENNNAGPVTVVRDHVIPNVSGTIITAVTQQAPGILLVEAAISFMLLTDSSVPSWGHTIRTGFVSQHQFIEIWWVSTIPVLVLAGTVVAFLVLGDALRETLDPESSR